MFLNGGGQEIGSPGEYGAGRERAGRRGKKEREVEVLKKGGKWEKLRNNTLVFRSQKGKRGEAKKKLASAGKANMESTRCSAPFYLVTLGTFCIVTCYIHLKDFFGPLCGSRPAPF